MGSFGEVPTWRKGELRRSGRRGRKIESRADKRGSYIPEICQTVFLLDQPFA